MDIEDEIESYLYEYGNTRESDLVRYGVDRFNYTSEKIKKVIKRMTVKGRIHFIVHDKLEPPEVYMSLKDPIPPETTKILLEAFNQVKTSNKDVKKILDQAADVAEQKSKKDKTGNFRA